MKPKMLIMLRLASTNGVLITAMAPRKQKGMPTITQKASLISRNRASTMNTSSAPMARFFTIIPSLPSR